MPEHMEAIEAIRDEREEDGDRPTWNSALRTLLHRGVKYSEQLRKRRKRR
jgi:hypothetical protein